MKRVEVHILQILAFVAVAAAAIGAVVALALQGPGTTTHTAVVSVAPQQASAAKVVMRSNVSASLKAQDTLPCPPPANEAVPGVCAPKPVQVIGATSATATPTLTPVKVDPPACTPDVSSWQGYHIDWGAVKRWQLSRGCTPSGIFKIGEYVTDPTAATNNAGLKANGMVRQGYWFIRNTGCFKEANQIRDEAKSLGLTVVWLDDEVPEGRNYTGPGCITPTLKAAGITAIGIYASPGAFPGGLTQPLSAWIAAYGPANPPRAPWGGPIKGFQCTDGVFGCVTYVPGIGRGDVSVDYGLTKLGARSVPNAKGCNNPSAWKSLCLGRFPNVTVYNGHKGGYCSRGCVERKLMVSYQYDRTHNRPDALKADVGRITFMHGRLVYLTAHRSLAQNEADWDYSRISELAARDHRALRLSYNGYRLAGSRL